MEFVVKGRNAEISDNFRAYVADKLQKIELFAPKAQRVDVEVTHEPNPAQAEISERIEITVRDKGPVIRAEAAASDRYGALDLAAQKLVEQLRRANERRKDHKHSNKWLQEPTEIDFDALVSLEVAPVLEEVPVVSAPVVPAQVGETVETQLGDSPVMVRQKLYEATPMTVNQALYEMELVGHPFYLFIDVETGQPCAAYRRHGWTYGVIRLDAKVV